MIASTLEDLRVPIDSLQPYPGNPRRGDVAVLVQSLRHHGQYRPIVVNTRTREVLAGNHTLQAARELGWTEIAATFVDADEATAKQIVLIDNRSNDLATYDFSVLAELLQSLPDLEGTGYDDDALAQVLAEIGDPDEDRGRDTEPPEPPPEARTELGDLYVLGEHRLLCGDANDPAALDRVYGKAKVGCVLADPPYGIDLNTDWSDVNGGTYRAVAGDDRPFEARALVERFADAPEQFWFGANYYRRTLSDTDLDGSWLVWDKRATDAVSALGEAVSADNMIGSGFELVWSRRRHQQRLLRHIWAGYYSQEKALDRVHPTQKPIALLEEVLDRWAPKACVVADPFLGSGSTLIACENTGRACYGLELDPAYCDVIVERYARHTNTPPAEPEAG